MSASTEDLRFYDLGNSASGSWYVLHLLAANGEHEALKVVLNTFSKRFVCPKCRFHIRDYLKSNPFPTTFAKQKTSLNKTIFNWTVDFHNAVNIRLGKPTLTEEERGDLYDELTTKADEDEKKVMDGGDCEGCGHVTGSSKDALLKETIERTKTRRSASFPPPQPQKQWVYPNISYL